MTKTKGQIAYEMRRDNPGMSWRTITSKIDDKCNRNNSINLAKRWALLNDMPWPIAQPLAPGPNRVENRIKENHDIVMAAYNMRKDNHSFEDIYEKYGVPQHHMKVFAKQNNLPWPIYITPWAEDCGKKAFDLRSSGKSWEEIGQIMGNKAVYRLCKRYVMENGLQMPMFRKTKNGIHWQTGNGRGRSTVDRKAEYKKVREDWHNEPEPGQLCPKDKRIEELEKEVALYKQIIRYLEEQYGIKSK